MHPLGCRQSPVTSRVGILTHMRPLNRTPNDRKKEGCLKNHHPERVFLGMLKCDQVTRSIFCSLSWE